MRRKLRPERVPQPQVFSLMWSLIAALAMFASPVLAQQTPSPQTAPAVGSSPSASSRPADSAPPPSLPPAPTIPPPAKVVVPAGTRIAVALDTPLSTRISKVGQLVQFRTSEALPVAENFAIPQDTLFAGKVVEARRPGAFGRGGALRVNIEHIELGNGATAGPVAARIEPTDPEANGRPSSDSNRKAALLNLALWSGQGALLGARIQGGKGAAVGGGAGAAIALIMMMSKRGADVYLEPGTPFLITLDQPVSLPGAALLAGQAGAAATSPGGGTASGSEAKAAGSSPAGASSAPSTDPSADPDRPKLKHRPKP